MATRPPASLFTYSGDDCLRSRASGGRRSSVPTPKEVARLGKLAGAPSFGVGGGTLFPASYRSATGALLLGTRVHPLKNEAALSSGGPLDGDHSDMGNGRFPVPITREGFAGFLRHRRHASGWRRVSRCDVNYFPVSSLARGRGGSPRISLMSPFGNGI
jgi:hypothetical protein